MGHGDNLFAAEKLAMFRNMYSEDRIVCSEVAETPCGLDKCFVVFNVWPRLDHQDL
jgi:hypothetical protein